MIIHPVIQKIPPFLPIKGFSFTPCPFPWRKLWITNWILRRQWFKQDTHQSIIMSESTGGSSCTYQVHSMLYHTLSLSIFGFENAHVSLMIFKLFSTLRVVLCVKYFLCPFSNSQTHTHTHSHILYGMSHVNFSSTLKILSSVISSFLPV